MSRARVLLAVAALFVLTSCDGQQAAPVVSGEVKPLTIELPEQVLGLKVAQEDVSGSLAAFKGRTYLESVGLFSMREGDLLRATYQVGRFNSLARAESKEFRRELAGLAGSPEELRMGSKEVSQVTGNQQITYIWFEGRGLYVLTVHREFPFGRTLLRKLIEMEKQR
ncbi:MAG: hypothetical protein ACRD1T_22075 [Acidimicrobiia bacterium]